MTTRRRKDDRPPSSHSAGGGSPAASAARPAGPKPPPPPGRKRKTWLETHGRDLRFLLTFAVLMAIYYAISTTTAVKDGFFPWYLELNARGAVATLHVVGYEDARQDGKSVSSSRGTIIVERGCDAIEPSALFVSAVLASPVPLVSRLLAVVVGTALLLTINLVRIISLFLCAVHWKQAFNVMHLDVWQALFIFLAILFWALWAAWATRKRPGQADAGT